MAVEKLTALKVARAKTPGYYGDGGGLYLRIGPEGNKHWVFRFKRKGRTREMGLGNLATFSLKEARERALHCRQKLYDGVDPIDERRAKRVTTAATAAKTMTFEECAEGFMADKRAGWSNAKHVSQWTNSLATYVYSQIGRLPIATVDTAHIIKIVQPIWQEKTETASRVLQRIAAVLDWATVRKFRSGANPAQWKGHLEHVLPKKQRVRKPVAHYAALPYGEMPRLMRELQQREGMASLALQYCILTCARTDEVLGATWDEIDLVACTWTVSGSRMKSRKEWRVPLAKPVMDIITPLYTTRSCDLVFPGRGGRKLAADVLRLLLGSLRPGVTVHGTARSGFADWAVECTNASREAREIALAHSVGTAVELAYRRSNKFAERRELAELWGRFCRGEAIPEAEGVQLTG